MRWAVERSARTVMRRSSDLEGRSRSVAQRVIWRLVASPRSSARSSSGAPTMRALSWLVALTLAAQAPWRVANSTRNVSRSPRRRGARGWSWAGGLPRRPDGVQGVTPGTGAPRRPLGPPDLDHALAAGLQKGGQPGAVTAGALDRPAAPAGQ